MREVATAALPLSRFSVFRTPDLDQAREEVAKIFCPHRLVPTGAARRLDACHHSVDLGGFTLNYVQYGADVLIEPGRLESFFLLQIPLTGTARIDAGRQEVAASATQASLLSPSLDVRMRWSADCGKLLVQIPRADMERGIQALLGRRLREPLEFSPLLPIEDGPGRRIADLVQLLREDADAGAPVFSQRAAGPQMRETLVMALLASLPHNHTEALRAAPAGIAPRHVRRAEAYMRAHFDQPLNLAEIAAAAGVSVRALQDGFRRFRDTTPLEALRQCRLDGAHADLRAAKPGDNVTSVALRWGFAHHGRFATAYAARFCELPSDTLRRHADPDH